MKAHVGMPDLDFPVGLGEALPQTSVINPVVLVVAGTNPEIPFAIAVIIIAIVT